MIVMALRAIISSATVAGRRRCVACRAAFHSRDHHLLAIPRGRTPAWRHDELRLVALLESECRLVTNAALHMAVGPMIESRVPQPDRGHFGWQNIGQVGLEPAGQSSRVMALLAPGRN